MLTPDEARRIADDLAPRFVCVDPDLAFDAGGRPC
jgi:hypothetical protein